MPVDFEKQSYWRDRFSSESSFEWLLSSEEFITILQPYFANLDPSARILHLGSGTSDLHNHFRRRGFLDVTNVDYEPLAAERGRQLEQQAFGDVKMRYVVADATQLLSGGGVRHSDRFDLVVDKSTADAVSCGGQEQVLRMARCVKKCLAEGAVWISLSYSSSRFRVDDLPFDVEVMAKVPTLKFKATDPDVYHWCYSMRPK